MWGCLGKVRIFYIKIKRIRFKTSDRDYLLCHIYIYTTLLLNKQFMKTLSYIKFNDAEFFWKYFSYEN